MIAVLAVCVLGPFSAIYVLGPAAAVPLLLAVGGMLGVTLGCGVKPGAFTAPDYITVVATGILVSIYFLLLLYMTCWTKVEAFFCSTPWLRHNGKMQLTEGGRKYATRCPFTGYRPNMRCPSCDARVHDTAFHKPDKLVMLPVGETVLRWDIAKLATEETGDLKKARRQLDQALDFRGNTLTCNMTGCCVGCATWQKCFNLLPRLSISLALAAVFFAFVPWGFASFLNGQSQNSSGTVTTSDSPGGKAAQVIAEVLAVLYAESALLVQLQALLRANKFLQKYRLMIPSLKPLFKPPTWRIMDYITQAPWEQQL